MQAIPDEGSEQCVSDEEDGEEEVREMWWRWLDLVPHGTVDLTRVFDASPSRRGYSSWYEGSLLRYFDRDIRIMKAASSQDCTAGLARVRSNFLRASV